MPAEKPEEEEVERGRCGWVDFGVREFREEISHISGDFLIISPEWKVLRCGNSHKRNGSVKTAAYAACPVDGTSIPGRREPPHPFYRGWPRRTGLHSHASGSTAIDFTAQRPAYLVRAPRHRGRAKPLVTAPICFRNDDTCCGFVLLNPDSRSDTIHGLSFCQISVSSSKPG